MTGGRSGGVCAMSLECDWLLGGGGFTRGVREVYMTGGGCVDAMSQVRCDVSLMTEKHAWEGVGGNVRLFFFPALCPHTAIMVSSQNISKVPIMRLVLS